MINLINANAETLRKDFNIKIRTKIVYSEQQLKKQIFSINKIDFWIGALHELVTNSIKHGNATAIIVMINIDGSSISMIVQDNGSGIESMENSKELLASGFGIRKIRDYLISIGGTLNMENQEGLVVTLKMPIKVGDKSE